MEEETIYTKDDLWYAGKLGMWVMVTFVALIVGQILFALIGCGFAYYNYSHIYKPETPEEYVQ